MKIMKKTRKNSVFDEKKTRFSENSVYIETQKINTEACHHEQERDETRQKPAQRKWIYSGNSPFVHTLLDLDFLSNARVVFFL